MGNNISMEMGLVEKYTHNVIIEKKDIIIQPIYGESSVRQKMKCIEVDDTILFGVNKIHIYYNKYNSFDNLYTIICEFLGENGIIAKRILSKNEYLEVNHDFYSDKYSFLKER